MKRIILSAIALVFGLGIASAQAPNNSKQPAVKTEKKEMQVVPAPKQGQPVKAVAPTSETKPATKLETVPAVKPRVEATTPSSKPTQAPATKAESKKPTTISPAGTTTKTKKDGTPDKRYKENKNLKKDGTPDMRYKQNQPASPKNDGTKKK